MSNNNLIHATLVSIGKYGVLLKGKSSSGKSDLALRLIESGRARLVADDIVEIFAKKGKVYGTSPENLRGLLEVRGVGIIKYPYVCRKTVDLSVNLVLQPQNIERMPRECSEKILGLEIPQIDLYAMENSAPQKIFAALRLICENKGEDNDND